MCWDARDIRVLNDIARRECVEKAVAKAVNDVNKPHLNALYSQEDEQGARLILWTHGLPAGAAVSGRLPWSPPSARTGTGRIIVNDRRRAESVAFRHAIRAEFPGRTRSGIPPHLPRVAPENRLVKSTPSTGESPLEADAREDSPRAGLEKSQLEAVIAREYSGLRLLISRRAGDPNVGADLLNEALCITWEKWQAHQIERADCIAGYIFQVAMNLLRNHRRSAVERPERRAATSVLETARARCGRRSTDRRQARRARESRAARHG